MAAMGVALNNVNQQLWTDAQRGDTVCFKHACSHTAFDPTSRDAGNRVHRACGQRACRRKTKKVRRPRFCVPSFKLIDRESAMANAQHASATSRDLFEALDNREWYSFSVAFLLRKLRVDAEGLLQLVNELDHALRGKRTDCVNMFAFNGVHYVGLESRRLAYEADKLAGTNHVERLVQLGFYG